MYKLIEETKNMYNPAFQTTDSKGGRYSEFCMDNLKSGGLGSLISHSKEITVEYKKGLVADLLEGRYSLVTREMMNDLDLEPNEEIEFGGADGFKCIRAHGVEYREKKSAIVVV